MAHAIEMPHWIHNTISLPTDIKQQYKNKRYEECDGAKNPAKSTDITFPFHVRLASKVVALTYPNSNYLTVNSLFFRFSFSCIFLPHRLFWCVKKRKKWTPNRKIKYRLHFLCSAQFLRLFCVWFIFALPWKCILITFNGWMQFSCGLMITFVRFFVYFLFHFSQWQRPSLIIIIIIVSIMQA